MKFYLITLLLLLTFNGHSKTLIAYNQLDDAAKQNYEVYVMNDDGSEPINISNSPAIDWLYYAYGNKLYFVSDRGQCRRCFYLYEMDAKGQNLRQLSPFRVADSWLGSRNHGTELIVTPAQDSDASFYIIDLKGNIIKRIKIDLPFSSDPTFSPDGLHIVFRGAHKASPRVPGFSDELYVTAVDKIQPRRLTFHPDAGSNTPWQGYRAAAPRWTNDNKISFASRREGNYDIYQINANGSGLKAVSPSENNQVFHDWHKDGTLIFEASMDNHSGYELYKQAPNGEVIQLTDDGVDQYAPVFVEAH